MSEVQLDALGNPLPADGARGEAVTAGTAQRVTTLERHVAAGVQADGAQHGILQLQHSTAQHNFHSSMHNTARTMLSGFEQCLKLVIFRTEQ